MQTSTVNTFNENQLNIAFRPNRKTRRRNLILLVVNCLQFSMLYTSISRFSQSYNIFNGKRIKLLTIKSQPIKLPIRVAVTGFKVNFDRQLSIHNPKSTCSIATHSEYFFCIL